MNIQSICLSQITASRGNPRRFFDIDAIEGLATSIRNDGLLQNLVVRPANGKAKRYAIVSGERRYRALKLLEERGQLPDGFTVPVEVRKNMNAEETLRLATVENLQRADLTPLEQTVALTRLVKKGEGIDSVAAQTGLSVTTIKRRLALNGLCAEAKASLENGLIVLAQAEALTLGNDEAQRGLLEEIERSHSTYGASDIKEALLDARPNVSMAVFPLEEYTGRITTDLFAEGETSYFDDVERFHTLQNAAVEKLAEQYRSRAPWVEVTHNWRMTDWHYRPAEEDEQGGVLINLSPKGVVEVREGLVKPDMDEDAMDTLGENPIAPVRNKASYGLSLRRLIAHHKSMAVQEMLLSDPRKAKEVAAFHELKNLSLHPCIRALEKETNPQSAYSVVEAQALLFAEKLALKVYDDRPWNAYPPVVTNDVTLYEAIKSLSDHELDELRTLLASLSFGQKYCDRLDTQDSLFNAVASDLNMDMRNHWRVDEAFLSKRTRDQLVSISNECGFADGRQVTGYKKSELVSGLLRYFNEAYSAIRPSASQEKARDWLPEVMLFPAVDPDGICRMEDMREAA